MAGLVSLGLHGDGGVGLHDRLAVDIERPPERTDRVFLPAYVLKGPMDITLKRWDRLNKKGRVVGIGELDNHDTPRKILGITVGVFSFKRAFRFIRTHLLLDNPLSGDAEEDTNALLGALRNGRTYMAMEYFREAKGFLLSISDHNREATSGGRVSVERGGHYWRSSFLKVG